jgi:hypothetical protein
LPVQHRARTEYTDGENDDHAHPNLAFPRFHEVARGFDAVDQFVLFQVVTFLTLHIQSLAYALPGFSSLITRSYPIQAALATLGLAAEHTRF